MELRINANDLTFGIEIETHINRTAPVTVGSYYNRNGANVGDALPRNHAGRPWECKEDGSIVTPNSDRRTAEFVSPIMKGAADLKSVEDVVRIIKADLGTTHATPDGTEYNGLGAKVNSSCGVHVHVAFPSDKIADLRKLVALVGGYEKGIFAATGTKNRERGRWARSIKGGWDRVYKNELRNARTMDGARNVAVMNQRYFGLNLSNFLSGRRPAVEFRFFSGSTNPAKIAAYVQMCVGLVQLALSMPASAHWDAAPAGPKFGRNDGPGVREINRLMSRLGWITTLKKRGYRAGIMAEGEEAKTEARRLKRTLRALATKYDATA